MQSPYLNLGQHGRAALRRWLVTVVYPFKFVIYCSALVLSLLLLAGWTDGSDAPRINVETVPKGVHIRAVHAHGEQGLVKISVRLARSDLRAPSMRHGHLVARIKWNSSDRSDEKIAKPCTVFRVVICEIRLKNRNLTDVSEISMSFLEKVDN